IKRAFCKFQHPRKRGIWNGNQSTNSRVRTDGASFFLYFRPYHNKILVTGKVAVEHKKNTPFLNKGVLF
ncbi:hypothetical protein, partial [Zobellia laminariae]|uniref:hypothetical protein n=1 Tax=Zobellia laminariae TaxID=248906 RepID=UPI003EF0F466